MKKATLSRVPRLVALGRAKSGGMSRPAAHGGHPPDDEVDCDFDEGEEGWEGQEIPVLSVKTLKKPLTKITSQRSKRSSTDAGVIREKPKQRRTKKVLHDPSESWSEEIPSAEKSADKSDDGKKSDEKSDEGKPTLSPEQNWDRNAA